MAVPLGVNIDDIKDDVLRIPGVAGVHHLHVWQLSDTTLVSSLHVRVDAEVIGADKGAGERGAQYMKLARAVRKSLHTYGIHSTTIQPEFCSAVNAKTRDTEEPGTEDESCREEDSGTDTAEQNGDCLLDCEDDCGPAGKCCGPPVTAAD